MLYNLFWEVFSIYCKLGKCVQKNVKIVFLALKMHGTAGCWEEPFMPYVLLVFQKLYLSDSVLPHFSGRSHVWEGGREGMASSQLLTASRCPFSHLTEIISLENKF